MSTQEITMHPAVKVRTTQIPNGITIITQHDPTVTNSKLRMHVQHNHPGVPDRIGRYLHDQIKASSKARALVRTRNSTAEFWMSGEKEGFFENLAELLEYLAKPKFSKKVLRSSRAIEQHLHDTAPRMRTIALSRIRDFKREEQITISDLEGFMRDCFVGKSIVISTVGRINHDEIVTVIDQRLGKLPRLSAKPANTAISNPKPIQQQMTFRQVEDTEPTRILIKTELHIGSSEEFSYRLAFRILYDNMFRLGCQYDIDMSFSDELQTAIRGPILRIDSGIASLSFHASTEKADIAEYMLSMIVSVINHWKSDKGITQELLDRARANYLRKYRSQLLNNANCAADENSRDFRLYGRVLSFDERVEMIETITLEQVQSATKHMGNSRFSMHVEGPCALPIPAGW